jgi:hypothetical protein
MILNVLSGMVLTFHKSCVIAELLPSATVTDFLNFIMHTFTFPKVFFKVFDFCGVKVTMKVFNEEMCLLLKACGLFYAEAIVIFDIKQYIL